MNLRCMTLVLCMFTVYLRGCQIGQGSSPSSSTASPLPHTRVLLLDAQAFPPGWRVEPYTPYCDRSERYRFSIRSFSRGAGTYGHVSQDVRVFPSEANAVNYYVHVLESDFRPLQAPKITFKRPTEIHHQSGIADAQHVGCGVDVVPACQAIYRYGQYFVQFYFSIDSGSDDGLQLTEIEPILRALDARVGEQLGITAPPVVPTSIP